MVTEKPEGKAPAERGQGQPVSHRATAQLLDELQDRYPSDPLRLIAVDRRANLGGAVGHEQVEDLIREPVRRMVRGEGLERAWLPTGLLKGLARRRGCNGLARLHLAGGDFPSPRVSDEPVTPQQQDAADGVPDHHPGCW